MDLAGYVINAVVVEGRSVAEVAACHDISRSWLYELLARFRERGDDALKPGSRRPRSSPTQVASAMEDEIVALRKSLSEEGLDAGAQTIHYHLLRRHSRRPQAVPSVATIWCILSRRGFVVAQPPQAAPKLLEAIPSGAAQRVLAGRHQALGPGRRKRRGGPQRGRRPLPAADRLPGLCHHQGRRRGGDVPPWGRRPATLAELQAQLDRFGSYYNTVRPHRALGRRTPAEAFAARTKAAPKLPPINAEGHHRVRRDRVDKGGRVSLRYRGGSGIRTRGALAQRFSRPPHSAALPSLHG